MKDWPVLYQRDRHNRLRTWFIQQDGNKFRSCTGLEDGAKIEHEWKFAVAKNLGKTNVTTPEDQATAQIEAMYEKRTFKNRSTYTRDEATQTVDFFSPMLAEGFNAAKAVYPLYSQPKLDGIRCVAVPEGLFSRNGKPFYSSNHIFNTLKYVRDKWSSVTLDGELYNHDLKADFEKIVSLVRREKLTEAQARECFEKVQYHVYDLYDENQPDMAFEDRNALLKEIVDELGSNFVKFVPTKLCMNIEEVELAFDEYEEAGYEGQMIRVAGSEYEINNRSNFLLKRKDFFDEEFVIKSISEGVGNWAGVAKSIEINVAEGLNQSSGMRGNKALAKDILDNAQGLVDTLVTVRFQGRTRTGRLRFPVVTKFWRTKERTM